MDLRIEVFGDQVTCKQDGRPAFSAPLKLFLEALVERNDYIPIEPIPEGVRLVRSRSDVMVLVLEEPPAVRTIRWLAEDSPAPYGQKAVYRTVRLAFPFLVLVIGFRGGALTGYQQCFFRTSPLRSTADMLCFPNLLNVASAYGQLCWLCLANLGNNLAGQPWSDKVGLIWKHLFGAGFNGSSEVHEGMSYWSATRNIDPRFASIEAWEEASKKEPLFPLRVPWRPIGRSVGAVVEETMSLLAPPGLPSTTAELVQVLGLAAARSGRTHRAR